MWVWRIIGIIAFGLGAVGLFLPVWPTTIFWIVAAGAFARSNPAWRDWIYARPGVGPHIEGFVERGTMTRSGKAGALSGMAAGSAIGAFLLWKHPFALGMTLGVLACVALFIVTRRNPDKK